MIIKKKFRHFQIQLNFIKTLLINYECKCHLEHRNFFFSISNAHLWT
jgi:hypothetical protein